ncbi:hypothetical protein [Salmonirosea aquatica]|uniref:DUF1080 domain-containing protein n=1 Tax=Salmonirosea aquatica TaxID=2654236 RepID=A0A7C9BBC3_9BACT|nr:hypothetical protein [Cytophagaceae bacterium SJW1-29]
MRILILSLCLVGVQAVSQNKMDSDEKITKNKKIKLDQHAVKLVNRQLDAQEKTEKGTLSLDARDGDGMAVVQTVQMWEGTLQVELRGENKPGGSFVGIAFNVKNDSTYEAVYFRPFNFKSDEKIRREHSIQYICHPDFGWSKLREQHEGVYEREFLNPPSPDDWFSVNLTISPEKVIVKETKSGQVLMEVGRLAKTTSGTIGLWVGNGSKGSFRNLSVPAQ